MGQIGAAGSNINIEAICDLIRSVVRDELQRIHCPPQPPAAGSISSLIRSEVQQALQVPLSSDVTSLDVTSTRTESRRASYARLLVMLRDSRATLLVTNFSNEQRHLFRRTAIAFAYPKRRR
ncbi:hypothetical protein HPB52_024694 [Rhipicephalus sanguineus]|uniref:Uncharacterized protein n=1 Tax=Rhipicephalus sanguineus TaxID=34632 RepID=A0A9D4TDY8_RHISA|nr:hypothetical protein HPB52_024694 [Rhipicephalus sanguineus]